MSGLVIVAVIGGVAVAAQAQLMGIMNKGMGTVGSVFITYGGGAVLIGLIVAFQRGGNLSLWPSMPWYTALAGVLGLVIVGSIGFASARIGIVSTLVALTAAQFIAAALIDHYGLIGAPVRPLDLSRAGGMVLLMAGVWLMVR